MKHTKTVMKWIAGLVAVLATALAITADNKNTLALLDVGGKLALLAAAIYGALKANRERKESGLSKEAFEMAKAGGPEKFLKQAKQVRLVMYFLCAFPMASFVYAACVGSMEGAFQMLAITTLIAAPFVGILYWNQNRIKRIAGQELARQQKRYATEPYK